MNAKEIISNIFGFITDLIMSFGVKLLAAALVLFIGFKLTKWLINRIVNGKGFHKMDPGVQSFIKSLLNILCKALIILTSASILGIPMTNFVAAIGSIGLAIGLAMQGSLSNVAGGIMILIFHPFGIGDFITASGISGTVKEITILYTMIDTVDNVRVVIPNGELSNATVQNVSFNDTRRCDLTVGISYSSNADLAVKLLTDMANDCEMVLKDKDIFCKVTSLDDCSVAVTLRVWVNSGDYWTVRHDFTKKAKELFDSNNIEIPFPQLDVHVNNN